MGAEDQRARNIAMDIYHSGGQFRRIQSSLAACDRCQGLMAATDLDVFAKFHQLPINCR
jgi:hypothetical protein